MSDSEDEFVLDFEAYYGELKRLSKRVLSGEYDHAKIGPTSLLHRWLSEILSEHSKITIENRGQLFGYARRRMKQILIEIARRSNAQKRGGDGGNSDKLKVLRAALELDDLPCHKVAKDHPGIYLELEAALEKLKEEKKQAWEVIDYRFYNRHTFNEIGQLLGISESSAKRKHVVGIAQLKSYLQGC